MTHDGGELPLHLLQPLSNEINAAESLLRSSLIQVERFRRISSDADPLLACLALAMEKLTKLTLGLATYHDTGAWPSKNAMKYDWGHQVAKLDSKCRAYIGLHSDRAANGPYIRRLSEQVDTDRQMALILATVDRYGTQGRFHNLDALAESPQDQPSPQSLWGSLENSIVDPHPSLLAKIGTDEFSFVQTFVNQAIRTSIHGWWTLYYRAWMSGIIGPNARVWSGTLDPPRVNH